MIKKIAGIVFLTILTFSGWGQSIWTNPITDSNPSAANPFTAGQTSNANIAVSGIGRGTGINPNAGSNRYNATSWGSAFDPNDYFTWTLTPNAGFEIDFVSLVFKAQSSGTGPTNYALRSSQDNYVANIATFSIPASGNETGPYTASLTSFQNINAAITFRLYAWGASDGSGTNSVNEFTFNGNVSSTSCTAPSTQASSITFSAVGSTSLNVNWTNGNGAGRVVIMNTTNSFTTPAAGNNPTANTVYGGSGQQVIYNGTGSGPVNITGLTQGTTYWFRVYEFCNPSREYQSASVTGNPNSVQTIIPNTITTTGTYGPYCNGTENAISVSYTSTGTYSGTFTAELSDENGSFSNPVIIGSGISPISAILPQGTAPGTGYRIRVVNDSPTTIGTANGADITIFQSPIVNLGNDTAYCAGISLNLTLNGGNAGALYQWNNFSTSQILNVGQAGTFYVSVTSANTCQSADTIIVTEYAQPTLDLGNDTSYCTGTIFTYTLDAGSGMQTYEWSDLSNQQTLSISEAGTYTVIVTNVNGCENMDTVIVTENPLPIVNIGADMEYCAGSNFSQTLDAGNAGATYSWNSGTTTAQTLTINGAGNYYVQVTDVNNCVASDTLIVTENVLPIVNLGADVEYCAGSNFSQALDAGNTGATYSWNNGAANTQTITVTAAGIYHVQVTDANNCEASDTLTITENALPIVDLGQDLEYCTGTNFSQTLDAGNAGATYSWNNGAATTQTFAVSTQGLYHVQVTDANNCINTDTLQVIENSLPVVNLGNDTSYCAGTSFSILLNAGNPGATYSWSGGNFTSQIFAVTQGGTYSVTVTDVNGCQASDQVVVSENPLPVVNLGNDTSYCAGSSFALVLDAQNPNSTYVWGNGSITQTVTATQSGVYSVTVTDENGCVNSDQLTVSQIASPIVSLGNDITTANTFYTLNAGPGFNSYHWTPGNQNTQQITVNQSGTYTVTVTNADGCSATDDIVITLGTASLPEATWVGAIAPVYPNPAENILYVPMTEIGDWKVEIRSITGQILFTTYNVTYLQNQVLEVDIQALSAGTYFIQMSKENQTSTQVFIVRK